MAPIFAFRNGDSTYAVPLESFEGGSAYMLDDGTHVFLYRQDLGRNQAATEDAWPKAMAFFKRHLMTAGATALR